MLQGKKINLNNFKSDLISDTIYESRIKNEDTRYGLKANIPASHGGISFGDILL